MSLDPDIVAAMDDDFDYEDPDNELEDDFIMQAMGEGGKGDSEDEDGEEWETDSDQMGGGRSDDEKDDEVPVTHNGSVLNCLDSSPGFDIGCAHSETLWGKITGRIFDYGGGGVCLSIENPSEFKMEKDCYLWITQQF